MTTQEQGPPSAESGAEEAGLGYEHARAQLVEVVQRLEAGGTSLEESLALWERGEELARVCREWLEGARARLDAVLESEGTEEDEESEDSEDDEDVEDDEDEDEEDGSQG